MTRVENKKILGGLIAMAMFATVACVDNGNNNTNNSNSTSTPNTTTEEKVAFPEGKTIYQKTCITCHGTDGAGAPGTYPPLAKSDYLLADKFRAVHQVIKGSATAYTVNGSTYNGVMPPQDLSDEEIANVLNYIYHSWGNHGDTLTAAQIKAVRDTIKK